MATKFYLKLKKVQGKCSPNSSVPCANLGELQAKLGSLNIVKSKALSCPNTVDFKPSGPLGVEFSSQGRLHLYKGNRHVYAGIPLILKNAEPNGKCLFAPTSDAIGGEPNCEVCVFYEVKTVSNLFALTRQFVGTVVKLFCIFFRRLFSAIVTYVQSLPIALTITVEEFLSLFSRSNPNRPDDRPDDSDDNSEPPADS